MSAAEYGSKDDTLGTTDRPPCYFVCSVILPIRICQASNDSPRYWATRISARQRWTEADIKLEFGALQY